MSKFEVSYSITMHYNVEVDAESPDEAKEKVFLYNTEELERTENVEIKRTDMETCTEWCPHCEQEVELPYQNKYHKCPNCQELIAPCAQNIHGENGNCICQNPNFFK